MRKISLIVFVLLAFSLVPVSAQKDAPDKSLIVSYCGIKSPRCDLWHLEKLRFSKGKLIGRKKIATLNQAAQVEASALTDNRYIPLRGGRYFDVVTEKIVKAPTKLPVFNTDEPRVVSPDGKKMIAVSKFSQADKIEIWRTNKPNIVINDKFESTADDIFRIRPFLPIMWIDNERILTQKSNGRLVIITLDEKITPFAEIPCSKDASNGLSRSKSGQIYYRCGNESYSLDVAKKTYKKSLTDLENGFFVDLSDRKTDFYFQNSLIATTGVLPLSTENYLSILPTKETNLFVNANEVKEINVWNNFTKKWQTFTFDGWDINALGWVE